MLLRLPDLPGPSSGATANQSDGFVTLTDVDNRAIEAKILDYRNGVVTVRTRNGTDSKISEARLKPESLAKVKHELSKKVMVRLRLDANPKLESKTKHFNSSGYRTATTTKVQNKKRSKNFEVTLDTTSPYEREVIVRWVITQGGEIFMGTERGVVGNKKVFEFGVDAVAASKTTRTETSVRTGPYWCGSWSGWATYVNEEIEGNDRVEMVGVRVRHRQKASGSKDDPQGFRRIHPPEDDGQSGELLRLKRRDLICGKFALE